MLLFLLNWLLVKIGFMCGFSGGGVFFGKIKFIIFILWNKFLKIGFEFNILFFLWEIKWVFFFLDLCIDLVFKGYLLWK